MTNGYRRYSRYYQAPPSPLHHLLGGVGTGITQSMERIIKEKERKRSMTNQVLESVIQGTDPRVFATDMGKDWLIENTRYQNPEIQNLILQGQVKADLLGPGGMGPPAPYTLPAHQEKLKGEIEAEEEREFQKKLEQIKRTEELKLQIQKDAQPSPEDIKRVQETLARFGLAPENITVKIDGVNYDLQTALEKAEVAKKVAEGKEKEAKTWDSRKEKYDNAVIVARKFRLSGMTKLSAILSGEPTDFDELSNLIKETMRSMAGKESKVAGKKELEAMTPQKRFEHLRLEFNKIIGAHNKKLKGLSSGLGLKEIDKLNLIGSTLEEIKPIEPIKDEQKRGVIITPKVPSEPDKEIDPSLVSPTEPTMVLNGVTHVARNGKWVKVKKIS